MQTVGMRCVATLHCQPTRLPRATRLQRRAVAASDGEFLLANRAAREKQTSRRWQDASTYLLVELDKVLGDLPESLSLALELIPEAIEEPAR